MAIITPYDSKVAIWLVAGDQVGENSIDEVAQTILTYAPAINAVWVKTSDGSDWMAKYDTKSSMHIDGPDAIDRWVNTLQKYGLEFHAWCVPRGQDIDAEANIIIQACQRPGVRSMILDVEPYPGFYAGDQSTVRPLMLKIRGAVPGAFHIGMSVDARQAHYDEIFPQEWFPFVNSIHPQAYWPDMGVTPQAAVDAAFQTWKNYGRPIFPALAGYNTQPAQIETARDLAVNKYGATGLSWWTFGHIDAPHFNAINKTIAGQIVPPAPGATAIPAKFGAPIVVPVGSPNYHDGVYDPNTGGFQTYTSPNGGTGKFRATNDHVADVWAAYDPKITVAGWYRIEVFVPNQHASTGNARYKIHGLKDHPNEWLVSAAQSSTNNDWMTLGTFQVDPTQQQPGVVFLDDWTFETGREMSWDAMRWTPVSSSVGAPIMIDVPYRSQEGPGARRYRNDCGPACVAMLIDWQRKVKGLPPQPITIDQLSSETALATHDTGLTTGQLVPLAAKHGVTLRLSNNATVQNQLAEVAAGRPFLSIISYAPLTGRENQADTGLHFVVLTGYDANNVYVNDPDWWNAGRTTMEQGHNWKVPITQYALAVEESSVPNQGCYITL